MVGCAPWTDAEGPERLGPMTQAGCAAFMGTSRVAELSTQRSVSCMPPHLANQLADHDRDAIVEC